MRESLKKFNKRLPLIAVIAVLLLPPLLNVIGRMVEKQMTKDRFDPTYFTDEYRALYADPQETIEAAVEAMITGDFSDMPAIQGLNNPAMITQNPNLSYLFPYDMYIGTDRTILTEAPNSWEAMRGPDVRFASFIFAERGSQNLHTLSVEQVDGRWVYVDSSFYIYMQTGRWSKFLKGVSFIYYFVAILVFVWIYMSRDEAIRKQKRLAAQPS